MTSVSDIIKYAFRQSNLTGVGRSPTDAEQTEALFYLNGIVSSSLGNEVGDPFTAFPIGSLNINRPAGYPWWDTVPDNNWFVPKNTRVMLNLDQSVDLYLHPDPNDGSRFAVVDVAGTLTSYPVTVYGNGRTIDGANTLLLNTNNVDSEWFYRDDTANWHKYSPLALTDDFPFPKDFDTYFITTLAMQINPAHGIALDPQSERRLQRDRSQIRARYSQVQPQRTELALIRMSRMAADRDRWGSTYWLYQPNQMFDKGWPW